MKAVILCAGYATRLYPLTINQPKALLPVLNKPLLDYIIEKTEKIEGIDKTYIVTNDKFHANFENWLSKRENAKKKMGNFQTSLVALDKKKIEIVNDKTTSNENRLGGLGDLWFAVKKFKIDDDLLIVCGDNLFDSDLNEMTDFFGKIKKPVIGVYDVGDANEARKMGVVSEKNGKIEVFEEKPQEPKGTLCSIGIYLYPRECIREIGEYMKTGKLKDGPGHLINYFLRFRDIHSFEIRGKWHDIGSLETYEKVRNAKI